MEFLGFGLALVGFLLAAGVGFRSMKKEEDANKREEELNEQLQKEKERAELFEAEVKRELTRAEELEKQLAEAVSRRDEKAMASIMWELELERSYRQWRDVIHPGKKKTNISGNKGQQLTFAISREIDRLREEVGVSIRFDGGFDIEIESERALGMLRISEELFAIAAKQADEVVVSLDQTEDPSIVMKLNGYSWDKRDEVSTRDIREALERMADKLDGTVDWQNTTKGDVEVIVLIPVIQEISQEK